MKNFSRLLTLFFLLTGFQLTAQESLPNITVNDFNGTVIVSWKNDYPVPVSNINIQRSYDSLRHFTTIGSVLNPNRENGFADGDPPYTRMYYRVFIGFEGGKYQITPSVRPKKVYDVENSDNGIHYSWQVSPITDSSKTSEPDIVEITPPSPPVIIPAEPVSPKKNVVTFPSQRIFTSKDNNVVINLPGAASRKYSVTFFDESENKVLELTKLPEEFLIIEKVNFVHAGWFHFEIYDDQKLIEKNKLYISKDLKISDQKKAGNK